MWTQVSTVNPNAQAQAGNCLAFVQDVFGAPVMYQSAWESWEANGSKHGTGDAMPVNQGVSFPLYFSHMGTYGNPPTYGNWGHVVAYIPGVGYLSSPGEGYGHEVLQSIEEIEARFNSSWVGWAEALNDMQVILHTPDPEPQPEPAPAPPVQNVYVVQVDDNLTTIADTLGVNWEELYAANRDVIGDDPNLIHPGQELVY